MNDTIKIVEKYFELSNESDMAEIRKMFTSSSTYSSDSTGIYLGVEQIMDMMTTFHKSFSELKWIINNTIEIRPGVFKIDFVFNGKGRDGQELDKTGTEWVIVFNGMLQHIEVRNNNL
ncbi:MAG: hypothetical protein V4469_00100 [Patescibacteria group bacterium]